MDLAGVASIAYLGGPQGTLSIPAPLALTIEGSSTMASTPGTLVATLVGAPAGATALILVDGTQIDSQTANPAGAVGPISLAIPDLSSGTHVLSAQVSGQADAQASFTVTLGSGSLPTPSAADTVPTDVTQPFEVRHWVLQDLAPGGLGSWVMPLNPVSMDALPVTRTLQADHATHATGSFSIGEAPDLPLDWGFAGYCPDQTFYDQLVAFSELKRRFYVIDHRGRAFIAAPVELDMVPRKRGVNDDGQFTDWRHDYTMKLVLYNARQPIQLS